jgi:hypothetical protein
MLPDYFAFSAMSQVGSLSLGTRKRATGYT